MLVAAELKLAPASPRLFLKSIKELDVGSYERIAHPAQVAADRI